MLRQGLALPRLELPRQRGVLLGVVDVEPLDGQLACTQLDGAEARDVVGLGHVGDQLLEHGADGVPVSPCKPIDGDKSLTREKYESIVARRAMHTALWGSYSPVGLGEVKYIASFDSSGDIEFRQVTDEDDEDE